MSYKIKKILIFCILCVFTFTFLFIQLDRSIEKQEMEKYIDNTPTYYTVKDYEGKIAIFRNEDTQPFIVYDSYISSLPQADQEKLKNGIIITNTDDLQRAIEDYTS